MSDWRNPWSRHYQSTWMERAGNRSLPDWLRVAAAAYGSHKANGHAMFGRGDLACLLARVNPETGEMACLDRRHVYRAIELAVEYGWLAPGSTARCLIVPGHAVSGGIGNPTDVCPQHVKAAAKAKATRPDLKVVGA
ncbi:MAG TPA: hypothetical protein VHE83_08945 [Mycobacteriales bacterium]|nr:hypothetical protein [Mycobacteriales bacterium]